MRDVIRRSRNTVRKVIRSRGDGVHLRTGGSSRCRSWGRGLAELERMLEANGDQVPTRSAADTLLRISEALDLVWAMAAATTRCGATPRTTWRWRSFGIDGADLCAVGVLAGRGLSVRLEPRVRGAGGGDDQGQGPRRSGCATVECSSSALIRARARRWCSTAHDRAFRLFQGACRRGIYDNMKTAVQTVLIGEGARVQPPLRAPGRIPACLALNRHARTPGDGAGLGRHQVEFPGPAQRRSVPDPAAPIFKCYDELKARLVDQCVA